MDYLVTFSLSKISGKQEVGNFQGYKGAPFCIDAPYIWALPVWDGGSKRLPRWFGALTVFGSIQLRKKVPQSARLSGWANRYLGNAQM